MKPMDLNLQVEEWPIDRLIPYANNARTHSDEQVAQIAGSIAEYGFVSPILVGDDGVMIAGHGRVMAARKLGMTTLPVIVLGHLSPTQRRALILADNKLTLNAGWDEELLKLELGALKVEDFDLEITGFNVEEIDQLLATEFPDEDGEEDPIPEPPAKPVSQPGDLWILGEHRLLCGDSTKGEDVKRLMHGERAQLFATDPPYLVDYDGTQHPANKARKAKKAKGDTSGTNGNKDWSDSYGITWDDSSQGPELYEGFIKAAVDHAIDTHAAWYFWHAFKRQAMLESVWEKFGAFVHQQIIWSKTRAVLTHAHYLWGHEPCFYGWIKGNRPSRVSKEYLSTVWHIAGLEGDERPEHPTHKPLDCFANPMRQHVKPGGLCYEPFSGSGSQIMAGEVTRRRVFAMEISPVYVDVTVKRFIQATDKIVYLDSSGGKTFEEVAKEREVDL